MILPSDMIKKHNLTVGMDIKHVNKLVFPIAISHIIKFGTYECLDS